MAFSTPLQCEVLNGPLKIEDEKWPGDLSQQHSAISFQLSAVGHPFPVPDCRLSVVGFEFSIVS
jgi:hypothetical protein